jgi:pyruvate,water dikinase
MNDQASIIDFAELTLADLALVGGKNASLGEMIGAMAREGIRVPAGFAVTAKVYRAYLTANDLDRLIDNTVSDMHAGQKSLGEAGAIIRAGIVAGEFSAQQRSEISNAYQRLCVSTESDSLPVAVRSSATAEDLPEASFAGQQESYLNVCGIDSLLDKCRDCYASLYTDRAIAYREENGFDHQQVALSIGVQQMVVADSAGVLFTIDTETGFPDAILINAAWGLGELVVKGSVNPDRYMVYKPLLDKSDAQPVIEKRCGSKDRKMIFSNPEAGEQGTEIISTTSEEQTSYVLSDADIMALSRWGAAIERHYGRAMDIEWARDSYGLCILQARPETVASRTNSGVLLNYKLTQSGESLLEGASVGGAIASGTVCRLDEPTDVDDFPEGAILVAERTDPDWVPVMRRAAGLITDVGGATSHAAIVSRELNLPAVIGTGDATAQLHQADEVTLDCSDGATGHVYRGLLEFAQQEIPLAGIPTTKTDVMINAAIPDSAMHWWSLPVDGIGLVRIEFIISAHIGVHPMALIHPEQVTDPVVMDKIVTRVKGYSQPSGFYVETLALGIGKIAASQYPRPVIVRMSDFKTNEYFGLLGGEFFEAREENPMLGFRGASRYYHPKFREAFLLECAAIKRVRETMGFENVIVMIPFCRTPEEADKVLAVMAEAGLTRGSKGLEIYVMCEIPANIILAEQFAQRFDGFSIGSNDLTQLVLGVDRDSSELKELFDARNEAVKRMIADLIPIAHEQGCKVGICGQAPSDHPEFAAFLVDCGIDSISINADSIVATKKSIAAAEKNRDKN